jgi:hypothetical protein
LIPGTSNLNRYLEIIWSFVVVPHGTGCFTLKLIGVSRWIFSKIYKLKLRQFVAEFLVVYTFVGCVSSGVCCITMDDGPRWQFRRWCFRARCNLVRLCSAANIYRRIQRHCTISVSRSAGWFRLLRACPNAVSSRVIHLVFHRLQHNCFSSLDLINMVY